MGEDLTKGRLCLCGHIEIEDSNGCLLETVPFREAVVVTGLSLV